MPRKKTKSLVPADPQKSSAAQFLTYVASTGAGGEKYEIRYEDENIWMSQKMLALVYGVEVNSVNYHIKKLSSLCGLRIANPRIECMEI